LSVASAVSDLHSLQDFPLAVNNFEYYSEHFALAVSALFYLQHLALAGQ
jgi:hypothetical protein